MGSVVCSPVMAIYHMHATVISRASGGSAVAAAAYRSGEKLIDARTGEQHDYSRRDGVDGAEIIAPEGAPDWVRDRDRLWNSGEDAEKRKDSQVAREVRVALPRELDPEQRRELVRGFVQAEFAGRGMVADVSYHDGNSVNPHAHILLTTRELNSDGFGGKDRSWNSKELLSGWREQWAESANRALERSGRAERIDHRTLAAQRAEAIERGQGVRAEKLDRDPEIHLGKSAWMARRRGEGNERTRRNDRICSGNRAREMERSQLTRERWALDAEIRAAKLQEAVSRGSAWALGAAEQGLARASGAALAVVNAIDEYPKRREEAKRAQQYWAIERDYQRQLAQLERDSMRRRRSGWGPPGRVAKAWHRLADTAKHIIETPKRLGEGVEFRQEWVQKKRERERELVRQRGAEASRKLEAAEAARQREREQREWEAAHPEEAARQRAEREAEAREWRAKWEQEREQEAARQREWEAVRQREAEAAKREAEATRQREREQEAARILEETAARARQREQEYARGRAEFIRSLDPASSKEQTWNEREMGQEWKKNNWSEAWQLERAATQAEQQRQRDRGPDRDYGPSR